MTYSPRKRHPRGVHVYADLVIDDYSVGPPAGNETKLNFDLTKEGKEKGVGTFLTRGDVKRLTKFLQGWLDRMERVSTYFPIKIKYSNGDVVIVQHSNELRSGESFTVLAINVKETEK